MITSHQLHPLPSTPSPCALPSAMSSASQCSLQLPATSLRSQNPVRPESPGVAPHLIARAARCATPSLSFPECASTDTSPSLGLRALVGKVHATHRQTYSGAAIACTSADKLFPCDGKVPSSGLKACSSSPLVPPAGFSPSTLQPTCSGGVCAEQSPAVTILHPARLHLDPAHLTGPAPRPRPHNGGASVFLRHRSRSSEHLRNPSPGLPLSNSDTTTGAHGDALLRSACSLGRMKPARARRNTRVRAILQCERFWPFLHRSVLCCDASYLSRTAFPTNTCTSSLGQLSCARS